MRKIILWTKLVFVLLNIFSSGLFVPVFGYEQVGDSESMESYLQNNYYGRKYSYDYVDVKGNQLTAGEPTIPLRQQQQQQQPARKINVVDNDDELMETGDSEIPPNDVDFQDSSEDLEVMVVGEDETPRAELLKRAKRYLSQINLASYTPASPFYSYYNPNFGSSSGANANSAANSNSQREATASSISSRTMESLLASCQLTNLLLYRAVNQKTSNLLDPIGTAGTADYARTVQHVPLAIGTFGAILEGNVAQRFPTPPSPPVEPTKPVSQPLQTYITTRTFVTTMTSTEVLRQGPTLSTHLRIYAFKTSKVHTLYFTRDVTPTPVANNLKPTASVTLAQAPSQIVPRVRIDDSISKIIGGTQNRTGSLTDTNRQKRRNFSEEKIAEDLESSEEEFDKDEEYAAYQYGPYRCPPIETETKTSTKTMTKTVTVVTTYTKYINPSPTYISSSSLRTLRNDYSNKRAQKSFENSRRIPFRPVGRLFTYTRAS